MHFALCHTRYALCRCTRYAHRCRCRARKAIFVSWILISFFVARNSAQCWSSKAISVPEKRFVCFRILLAELLTQPVSMRGQSTLNAIERYVGNGGTEAFSGFSLSRRVSFTFSSPSLFKRESVEKKKRKIKSCESSRNLLRYVSVDQNF
jgi:hypothetical protein